jgi:hypothetical protein
MYWIVEITLKKERGNPPHSPLEIPFHYNHVLDIYPI